MMEERRTTPVLTPEERKNLIAGAEATTAKLAAGGLLNEHQSKRFKDYLTEAIREDQERFSAWRENVKKGLIHLLGPRLEDDYAGEPERLERVLAGLEDRGSDLALLLYATHDRRYTYTAAEQALCVPKKLIKLRQGE